MHGGSLERDVSEDCVAAGKGVSATTFLAKLNELEARVQKELKAVKDQEEFISALKEKLARAKGNWSSELLQGTTSCLDALAAYDAARRARLFRQHGFTQMLEQVYAQKVALHKKIQPLLNQATRMSRPISPPRLPSADAPLFVDFHQDDSILTTLPRYQQTPQPNLLPLIDQRFQQQGLVTSDTNKQEPVTEASLETKHKSCETKRKSHDYVKASAGGAHDMMVLAADAPCRPSPDRPRPQDRPPPPDTRLSHATRDAAPNNNRGSIVMSFVAGGLMGETETSSKIDDNEGDGALAAKDGALAFLFD